MSLPKDNCNFECGDFRGFNTEGLCFVTKSFDAFLRQHTFYPVAGTCFAVLDDPRRIDGDGNRKPAPADPKPATLSHLTFTPDANGQTTLAGDGAVLE